MLLIVCDRLFVLLMSLDLLAEQLREAVRRQQLQREVLGGDVFVDCVCVCCLFVCVCVCLFVCVFVCLLVS